MLPSLNTKCTTNTTTTTSRPSCHRLFDSEEDNLPSKKVLEGDCVKRTGLAEVKFAVATSSKNIRKQRKGYVNNFFLIWGKNEKNARD